MLRQPDVLTETEKNADRVHFPRPIDRTQDGRDNPDQTASAVDLGRVICFGRYAECVRSLHLAALFDGLNEVEDVDASDQK